MKTFKWLYHPQKSFSWRFVRNVILKAALLFIILNLIFVLVDPLSALGKMSAYNLVLQGRERLPYGENPDVSYNLSLYQLDAMFASHELARAGHDGEYRVLLIGDSATWGILLEPEETLAGQINAGDYRSADGQHIRAYNLGYPTMSLLKDLMLLKLAIEYEPDLIVWIFTLESFDKQRQLEPAIVQNNADVVRNLIETYTLDQSTDDTRFVEHSTWDQTIIGQRRALADMLRLQLYGVPWAVTGIDQAYPQDYTPRAVDLDTDRTWHNYAQGELTRDDLAFDILQAGIELAGEIPVLLVNEPMLISEGANSDIRYNFFYPRWAYDTYRDWLTQQAEANNWTLLDLWDELPEADCYTDSAVHLTPECSTRLSAQVGPAIEQMTMSDSYPSP